MRLERRRRRLRAIRRSRELRSLHDLTRQISPGDVLLFSTVRNERIRLPYFLRYYRKLGVGHFLVVDNGSDDGTAEYLCRQNDVSLWGSKGSYRESQFGADWLNYLQNRYAHGHWILVVDPDEFLVFAHCDTRPVQALTDWLDAGNVKSFSAMLLDVYPGGAVAGATYREGDNPLNVLPYFDAGNYTACENPRYGNLWIQGGPRQRAFFADRPADAPALNKIPLVKWKRGSVYVSSTHMLLPRGYNQVHDRWGGEKPSGCLLHAKFLPVLKDKATEELERKQHYANGREYKAYLKHGGHENSLWTPKSEKYQGWAQLEEFGLMSSGGWI
ncbi:MAG: glycosyltransferase family 2 protein [Paracoccaceae bacterium]